MINKMEITYIVNSCFLISDGRTKIMVDGPIVSEYRDGILWDAMEEDEANKIIQGEGAFENLACLLISHGHTDHYDCRRAYHYSMNTGGKVAAAMETFDAFPVKWNSQGRLDRNHMIVLRGNRGMFKVGTFDIYYYKTKHLPGVNSPLEEHYAFVIESGAGRLFYSGDMCMEDNIISKLQKHGKYDVAIVNPMIVMNKNWLENFAKLDVDQRFVCHLPSEENDAYYYRKAIQTAASKSDLHYKPLLKRNIKL